MEGGDNSKSAKEEEEEEEEEEEYLEIIIMNIQWALNVIVSRQTVNISP